MLIIQGVSNLLWLQVFFNQNVPHVQNIVLGGVQAYPFNKNGVNVEKW